MTERAAIATAPPVAFVDLAAQQARIKPEVDARIQAVLAHGRYILGPEVAELETALAAFAGVGHAVGVASGTDALLVALMAEQIGPGDAVLLPAFTFTATAEVIALLGATPVFVDVDARSFNIDPADLKRKLAAPRDARPRAVIAVDLFGLPADYPALHQIAQAHDLLVIADGAQSFGAALNGNRVGKLAPVTALSFFPAKPLGCYGDGGALLTDDADRAALYRSIRAHGKAADKYDIARIGLNSRLDTIQAAILLAKLTVFEDELAVRDANARAYDQALGDHVLTPVRPAGAQSAWAQYSILCNDRDGLRARLAAADIPSAVYYPKPLHQQPAYRARADAPLPVSERLCSRILSLPMHPYLTADDIARVCEPIVANA